MTSIKRKKQTDAGRLLWRIVYWRRYVDWLRIDIRLLIPGPVQKVIAIAMPFLMSVITVPFAPTMMTVVMICERRRY